MKVKLGMIKIAEEAAQKLLASDLNVKTAWKLRKAFNILKKELEDLEEVRIKLVNKYGTPDPHNPGSINVSPEKLADFLKEFNPLLEQEIELKYSPIPVSEILEANIDFSPIQLSYLEDIGLIYDDVNNLENLESKDNSEEQ